MVVYCRSVTLVRWSRTLIVLLAMTNAGVNLGIFSPTFPAIESLTSSTTAQVSTTLVWMGVASVLGSVLLGSLFDHCRDGMILLAGALLLQGVAVGLAPYFRSLYAYQAFAAIASFFNFGIMAGSLSMNGRYWIDFSSLLGPIVQATVLMHTVGTALTPQIIKPFLDEGHGYCKKPVQNISQVTESLSTNTIINTTASTSMTSYTSQISINITFVTTTPIVPNALLAPVQMAYFVVAAFDILVSAVCLVTYLLALKQCAMLCSKVHIVGAVSCASDDDIDEPLMSESSSITDDMFSPTDSSFSRRRPVSRHENESTSSSLIVSHSHDPISNESNTSISMWNCPSILLMIVICLFFLINGGRDAMLTGMLYTYTCENLGWTIAWSTRLVTIYHLTRVAVHVIIVFVSRCVSPRVLTIFNLAILILTSTIMLGTMYTQDGVLFTGTSVVVMGIATSNITPTAITLTEQSLHVSAKIMGVLLAAIACGQIIVSPVTGIILQSNHGVVGFPALLLSLSLTGTIVFVLWMTCIGQSCIRRHLKCDNGPKYNSADMVD